MNSKDPVDLWESQDDCGKLHFSYSVCFDPSTFSIYGAHGPEECIIVALEIIFHSYEEWAFFSPIPTL